MKKLLLIFIILFVVTGCTNNIIYEFEEDYIKSTIELGFSTEEFEEYNNLTGGHANEEFQNESTLEDFINKTYESSGVIATVEDNEVEYYESTEKEKKDNQYYYEYKYNYTYDNFEKNYYLNECFQHFIVTDDEKYIHYNISGDFTCENMDSFTLKVKAQDKEIVSNADNKNDGFHIWKIENENNDIVFSISKAKKEETSIFGTVHIIGLVLLIILGVLGFLIYKFTNKSK